MPVVHAFPFYFPHDFSRVVGEIQVFEEWICPTTYDEILQMLEDIESGAIDKRYSTAKLQKVNDFLALLAREGICCHEKNLLEEDIYALTDPFFNENRLAYTIFPSIDHSYDIIQCGGFSDAWKSTKKFVRKHKKAIIIGAVVVVAVTAVTVAVIVASSTTAGAAAGTAASVAGAAVSSETGSSHLGGSESGDHSADSKESHVSNAFNETFMKEMEGEISSFKETIANEHFFDSSDANGSRLSIEDTGRVVGPIFAHDYFNHFCNHFPHYFLENENKDFVGLGHQEIDHTFSTDYGLMFSNPSQELNVTALSYQMRGDVARAHGCYEMAVEDFSKAIEMNSKDPTLYLQRGASYFEAGQYENSIKDFQHFSTEVEKVSQKIEFSCTDFAMGFAKGLPKGIYESGKGTVLFLGDLITHPIHTATQMYDALSMLASLAKKDEWGLLGEALSPEIHQLMAQWDSLPSDKRGELAGFAFGKYGADIAVPGAIAKIASKSVKSAQELAVVLKDLQIAEGTLVLETVAGVGNAAKIEEIVSVGKQTVFLGEELGFSAKEMGQLKQAGKLEQAFDSACESWLAKTPSEAYITAKNGGKHARLIDFEQRSVKEVQKSIKSLEKQIVKHQDKIANPLKYCPDWDTMDPRRKNALINKRWPAEIQCFTEEREILQTILDQMIEN